MTRHGHGRNRPPYQATTISQSATQLQQAALHRLRNPWVPGDSQSSTNSSSSSRTYHGIASDGFSSPIYFSPIPEDQPQYENDPSCGYNINPMPTVDLEYYTRSVAPSSAVAGGDRKPYDSRQCYRTDLEPFHGRVYPEEAPERRYFNHNSERRVVESDTLYNPHRYADVERAAKEVYPQARNYLDDHGRVVYQPARIAHVSQHGRVIPSSGTVSERAQSPGSLTGRGAVDGCGGHCVACQNFCYYFLQVIFVIGILTGISLCIAGSVLRRNRGKDLSVLVYIGCLISLVCAVLLSIQYCVRRNVERRKKALRLALNVMPMNEMVLQPAPVTHLPAQIAIGSQHHSIGLDSRGGFARDTFRSGMSTVPIMSGHGNEIPDQNGIPWWRRDPIRQ